MRIFSWLFQNLCRISTKSLLVALSFHKYQHPSAIPFRAQRSSLPAPQKPYQETFQVSPEVRKNPPKNQHSLGFGLLHSYTSKGPSASSSQELLSISSISSL